MSYVISIDVGIKNLALCAYDFVTNQVVYWDNVSLVRNGRYIPAQNVQYVIDFVHLHDTLFRKAHIIVVERQMRCNMRIIEAVFQTLFFDRCVIVNPRCVKLHYGIGTRNYKQNKAKAIEWVQHFITANPQAFQLNTSERFVKGKQDDLADALLLVLYYLDTYSNQLSVTHA